MEVPSSGPGTRANSPTTSIAGIIIDQATAFTTIDESTHGLLNSLCISSVGVNMVIGAITVTVIDRNVV